MIALGGPKLKLGNAPFYKTIYGVSMIALGGPKLKPHGVMRLSAVRIVSMIALGGPKLKPQKRHCSAPGQKFQ